MKTPRNQMQLIANSVKNRLPEGYGFIVLAYPHGESGKMFYVSNSQREDVVKALKEFIVKTEETFGIETEEDKF